MLASRSPAGARYTQIYSASVRCLACSMPNFAILNLCRSDKPDEHKQLMLVPNMATTLAVQAIYRCLYGKDVSGAVLSLRDSDCSLEKSPEVLLSLVEAAVNNGEHHVNNGEILHV